MFLQMHFLTSHHATLLNRDEAGLAKRITFGDAARLRVSSQCQKKHWRDELHRVLDTTPALRSRYAFSRVVLPALINEHGIEEETAKKLTMALAEAVLKSADKKKPLDDELKLKQAILFGKPELDYFVTTIVEAVKAADVEGKTGKDLDKALTDAVKDRVKAEKANFNALVAQSGMGETAKGIEGALFGRFITSDIYARTDAPVHVAHAFTVHPDQVDVDYFSVADDLQTSEETGGAHINDTELGAGVFYGYVAIDVPLLVSNMTGCDPKDWREQGSGDVRQVLAALLKAIATVTPGAKKGSTAPYAFSDFVLIEATNNQPRSLSNAFLKALPSKGHVVTQAAQALLGHAKRLNDMYGSDTASKAIATSLSLDEVEICPLDQAINTNLDAIFNAGA